MNKEAEIRYAQVIKNYVDFLKGKDKKLYILASELNVTPVTLSNLINAKEKNLRHTFSYVNAESEGRQFSRKDFIDKLEKQYGLSLLPDGQIRKDASVLANDEPKAQIYYFIYHHLEYNRKEQPVFKKSLLLIKSHRQKRYAELYIEKVKKVIKYNGTVFEEPGQLKLHLIKEGKSSGIEDSVVFIYLDDAELNNQILYGTFQASGPSFGLVVLEKLNHFIPVEVLMNRTTPPTIALDLLNQHLNPEGNYSPLADMSQHPQHNLLENISDFFGVYEGVTLVPNFDQHNHFAFEIQPDFKVFYSSSTTKSLEGIARPYKDSLFYIQLEYSKELRFYLKEIILKLKEIQGTNCMAGVMAGINHNNAPLSGIAMIKKSTQSFELLSKQVKRSNWNDMQEKFPRIEEFLAGSEQFSNYVVSDSAKTLVQFFQQHNIELSIISEQLKKNRITLSFTVTPEQAELWAGVYNIYRLSTDGKEIIVNLAKLNADGTAELKGYRHNNLFSGYWFLVNDHLTLLLDCKNAITPFLFVLAYRVGSSSRKEHQWFHGLSLSQTTLSEIRSGLEVMHISNEDFEKGKAVSIKIPSNGKHSETYTNLNRTRSGLASFLTGRRQNILHQTRRPEDPFEQEYNLKATFYNSACLFAIKASSAPPKSEIQAECYENFKRELLMAIEHGFGQNEGDLSDLGRERAEGYFQNIPPKYWDEIHNIVFGKDNGAANRFNFT
jgi:hypothetical protein